MANGYKISIDLGQPKHSFTIADSAPGSAGIEILVDHTKFLTTGDISKALEQAAELVLEKDQPMA
ncbi:MAG: hypothetical protein AB7Q04_12955 [Steroidobacteraceae bacterium]